MLFQQRFTHAMDFFNDRILGHDSLSISSSGVQTNGGSYPTPRQTSYTRGRMTAFAMCAQFHVSKLVDPMNCGDGNMQRVELRLGGDSGSAHELISQRSRLGRNVEKW